MKSWAKFSFLSLIFIFASFINLEARGKYQGIASKGGKNVQVSLSNYKVAETYPSCTITVYLTGTITLASIYSNDSGTVKANPFTANSDASYFFYADDGRYDIKFSGTGITSPFTIADVAVLDIDNVVNGPITTTSTDNAIVRWEGTDGKEIQNSVVIVSDTGNITGALEIEATGLKISRATPYKFLLLDRTDQPSSPRLQIDVDNGSLVISPQTHIGLVNKFTSIEGAALDGTGVQIFDWALDREKIFTTSSIFRIMDSSGTLYRDLVAKDLLLDGTSGTSTIYTAANVIFRKISDNQLPDLLTLGNTQFLGTNVTFAPVSDTAKRIEFLSTGQFLSAVPTGVAPFDVASSTPVTELIVSNHPLVYDAVGNLQSTQKLVSSSATLSAGTIVITFTGASVFANTNYRCVGANKTNANPFKIANTSASSITITGTGTDVIDFNCLGN